MLKSSPSFDKFKSLLRATKVLFMSMNEWTMIDLLSVRSGSRGAGSHINGEYRGGRRGRYWYHE